MGHNNAIMHTPRAYHMIRFDFFKYNNNNNNTIYKCRFRRFRVIVTYRTVYTHIEWQQWRVYRVCKSVFCRQWRLNRPTDWQYRKKFFWNCIRMRIQYSIRAHPFRKYSFQCISIKKLLKIFTIYIVLWRTDISTVINLGEFVLECFEF